MLKISITLPNNAQINLETADAAVIDKILDVVLLDITRNLTNGAVAAVNSSPPPAAPVSENPPAPAENPAPDTLPAAAIPTADWEMSPISWPAADPADSSDPETDFDPEDDEDWPDYADDVAADIAAATVAPSLPATNGIASPRPGLCTPSEQAYIDFCREANPLGDMRRVVVAAEGASRYLGMSGVDAQGLGHLFNLAGWPQAHNFTQTLRNSARSKFRWLERVPGRAGYYAVTDLGRKTALGD